MDEKYIEEFRKIKISRILRDLYIDKGNFYTGRISKENFRLIKEEIKRELEELKKYDQE